MLVLVVIVAVVVVAAAVIGFALISHRAAAWPVTMPMVFVALGVATAASGWVTLDVEAEGKTYSLASLGLVTTIVCGTCLAIPYKDSDGSSEWIGILLAVLSIANLFFRGVSDLSHERERIATIQVGPSF